MRRRRRGCRSRDDRKACDGAAGPILPDRAQLPITVGPCHGRSVFWPARSRWLRRVGYFPTDRACVSQNGCSPQIHEGMPVESCLRFRVLIGASSVLVSARCHWPLALLPPPGVAGAHGRRRVPPCRRLCRDCPTPPAALWYFRGEPIAVKPFWRDAPVHRALRQFCPRRRFRLRHCGNERRGRARLSPPSVRTGSGNRAPPCVPAAAAAGCAFRWFQSKRAP